MWVARKREPLLALHPLFSEKVLLSVHTPQQRRVYEQRHVRRGRLRSLEAVPVYAQLPYFGFECLSGNAQPNGGAGWTPNHAFGFPESGFEDLSFVLGKVSNQRSSRRSQFGSHVREPGLIYKESLPFRENHRPLDYISVTRGC